MISLKEQIERSEHSVSVVRKWGDGNPAVAISRMDKEIERLQKKCDYKDEVIDQRNAECSRQFKKIERLRAFVDAFDEMDEVQPYDGYYKDVIEKVWAARAALEDEYTIKIKGIPSKLEPPEEEDNDE